jgi:hypothetical protein
LNQRDARRDVLEDGKEAAASERRRLTFELSE